MTQKRHRIDFSLLRRRHNISSTSSTSLSPTVPVLESPISFHAFASHNVSEATLRQINKLNRAPVKPSMFLEDKEDDDATAPNLTHGAPKDGRSVRMAQRSSNDEEPLTRTKSQYFEDVFATRGPGVTPATRVNQDSCVVIEIKVNIRVKEEDSVISSLITRMAQIYQKSEASMVVTIQQDACLRFGSPTLPAYSMKVFALPYLIAPITNLRSTILIQAALHELLHIMPARGVILYIPVAEENMATNSTTMMGEIARREREYNDQETGILKSLSRSMSRRMKSSSSQSRPLSVATTSSWTAGSDVGAKHDGLTGSESTNASKEAGYTRSGKS